jgi:ADP-ribose pyrophosphatase YjhB (NUDIX family)
MTLELYGIKQAAQEKPEADLEQETQTSTIPRWLTWGRELQALAQIGIHYAVNEFDRERYQRLANIAAEILNEYGQLPQERLQVLFDVQTGYATPRIDVRSAVFNDGKLLMVRERSDNGWTLPGGWADVGDTPATAAEREVWEEAGYRVRASRLVGVYDANRAGVLELFHAYKIIFLCDLVSGEARPSSETSEVAFFSRYEIPQALSGRRTTPRQIEDAFRAVSDPNFVTIFD